MNRKNLFKLRTFSNLLHMYIWIDGRMYIEYLTRQTYMTITYIKGKYKWIDKSFSNTNFLLYMYVYLDVYLFICESTEVYRIFDTTNLCMWQLHTWKENINESKNPLQNTNIRCYTYMYVYMDVYLFICELTDVYRLFDMTNLWQFHT